jgi:hypothetical protein
MNTVLFFFSLYDRASLILLLSPPGISRGVEANSIALLASRLYPELRGAIVSSEILPIALSI